MLDNSGLPASSEILSGFVVQPDGCPAADVS
jgi:hypothetical protein